MKVPKGQIKENYPNLLEQNFPFSCRIELEKTLQQCIHEKDDYKEKYEECNR